jgi:hypothetical protein
MSSAVSALSNHGRHAGLAPGVCQLQRRQRAVSLRNATIRQSAARARPTDAGVAVGDPPACFAAVASTGDTGAAGANFPDAPSASRHHAVVAISTHR